MSYRQPFKYRRLPTIVTVSAINATAERPARRVVPQAQYSLYNSSQPLSQERLKTNEMSVLWLDV
jgi:hypothetical protein